MTNQQIDLENAIVNYGVEALQARFDKLKSKRRVFFPFLRVRLLLRKARILGGK